MLSEKECLKQLRDMTNDYNLERDIRGVFGSSSINKEMLAYSKCKTIEEKKKFGILITSTLFYVNVIDKSWNIDRFKYDYNYVLGKYIPEEFKLEYMTISDPYENDNISIILSMKNHNIEREP